MSEQPIRLARKFDRRRFDLSPQAEALLRQRAHWQRVELADGPAAQSLLLAGPSPAPSATLDLFAPAEPESAATPDQGELNV